MLGLLVGNSLRLLRDAMGQQAQAQARQIAPVLSAALVAPLAQYDYATVQAVLQESHAIQGIDYLAVTDASGAVVAASGWPASQPLPDASKGFSLDADPPRYDVSQPITQSLKRFTLIGLPNIKVRIRSPVHVLRICALLSLIISVKKGIS